MFASSFWLWHDGMMTRLRECLVNTKNRVFKVGDRIVHTSSPNIHTIKSFIMERGRTLMTLDKYDEEMFCTTYWSKVK